MIPQCTQRADAPQESVAEAMSGYDVPPEEIPDGYVDMSELG